MGADEGAEAALDAVLGDPGRNIHSDAPLFVSSGALREGAVRAVAHEGGNRQTIALLIVDGDDDVIDEIDQIFPGAGSFHGVVGIGSGLPALGDLHFVNALSAGVDGVMVHLDDGLALLGVRSGGSVLHVLDGVLSGQDVGELEESRL